MKLRQTKGLVTPTHAPPVVSVAPDGPRYDQVSVHPGSPPCAYIVILPEFVDEHLTVPEKLGLIFLIVIVSLVIKHGDEDPVFFFF